MKGGEKMKNILTILLIFLMSISLVLGANLEAGANLDSSQSGQQTGNGTQSNTETQNQGESSQIQNQLSVQVGTYMNQNGVQMQIQQGEGNEIKLQSGNVEAKTTMTMTQEQVQNKTMLKVQLSNGMNAEVKVMPDTASEKAIERLRLKVCSSENNCSIELKEVGTGEQVKAAYEVQAQKEARVFALFKTQMKVQAQIDAETGEVIQAKKPWWAFLAAE